MIEFDETTGDVLGIEPPNVIADAMEAAQPALASMMLDQAAIAFGAALVRASFFYDDENKPHSMNADHAAELAYDYAEALAAERAKRDGGAS